MANSGVADRTAREWLSSLPACLLLLAVVIFSTSSDIHNKMLKTGQSLWDGYYNLRSDPVAPSCDPDADIDAQVQQRLAQEQNKPDDGLGGLFDDEPLSPEVIRQSLVNAQLDCQARHQRYENLKEKITPGLTVFRAVELFVADLISFGLTSQRFILALLVTVCAATATLSRHHIAMRPMETMLDHRVSSLAQFVANSMLLVSVWSFRELSHATSDSVEMSREILHWMWIVCFGLLALVSGFQVFRVPQKAKPGGHLGHALLAVPLYTTMCLIAGSYFMFGGHIAGVGIYLDKMMDFSDTFLNVALYVWAGMMLKQTRLAKLIFNLFRPWKLQPELLAFLVVMLAAIPTAYTGASGIFVIAAGAVIYAELRAAGARRHLALAATAMSGSLGVVLRPCLLVVVIAMLNRQVTTDQLFEWGLYVFILTGVLFFLATMFLNRQSKFTMAPVSQAFPVMARESTALIPYVLVIVATVLFYSSVLDVRLNEFSAPRILPVMLLAILVYEHFALRKERTAAMGGMTGSAAGVMPLVAMADGQSKPDHSQPNRSFEGSLRWATNDTTAEIGALLLLFGLSVSIGGVIERSGLMEAFPASFSSPWMAMILMVVILVFLGMIMDAFGAIILVSATIASIAYDSGIHPIHFWMVTLVAFELGYLSPPVALNHLLTRQVVGEEEMRLAEMKDGTFYQRYERYLMPLIVMGAALLLVAFVPLAIGYS